jgi:hypothetical protein
VIPDSLLKYAIEHEVVSKRLIEIYELPKTSWSPVEAHEYYMEFKHAADERSGFAMCVCAWFCRIGLGVTSSGLAAIEWGEKAAKESFAPGYFEIGCCYEEGLDVKKDLLKAQACFKDSAHAGYGYAATYLAQKYHDGSLGCMDIDQALSYAKLGYQHGDSTAPLLLGGWYENGDGVLQSDENAVYWYERASELNCFLASERLHRAYEFGEFGLVVDKIKAKKYLDLFESQTEMMA